VNPELYNLRKKDWINLTEERFNELFTGTPVESKGYAHLMKIIRLVDGILIDQIPALPRPRPFPGRGRITLI